MLADMDAIAANGTERSPTGAVRSIARNVGAEGVLHWGCHERIQRGVRCGRGGEMLLRCCLVVVEEVDEDEVRVVRACAIVRSSTKNRVAYVQQVYNNHYKFDTFSLLFDIFLFLHLQHLTVAK